MVQSQRRAPSTSQAVLMAQAPSPLGPSPARAATSPPNLGCARNPSGPSAGPNLPSAPHRPLPPALLTGPSHWPFSLALLTGPSHWPFPLALPTGPSHWPFSHWPVPTRLFPLVFPRLSFPLAFRSGLSLWPATGRLGRAAERVGPLRPILFARRASGGPKCFQWGQDRFSVRPTNSSARDRSAPCVPPSASPMSYAASRLSVRYRCTPRAPA